MEYFGIDLGTSKCILAKLTRDILGDFEISTVNDSEGNIHIPSVVHFKTETNILVGEHAAKLLLISPDNTIDLIKVRLGKSKIIEIKTEEGRFEKTPQEISAYLLDYLKNMDKKVSSPVITVPAFFEQGQKDATWQSGEIARLETKQLIEEPTAAIMYYIHSLYQNDKVNFFSKSSSKNILVFDFGGGTLDLSLVKLEYESNQVKPTVLVTHGDPELGGNLIDIVFTKKVIDMLSNDHRSDPFIQKVSSAFDDYFINYNNKSRFQFAPDFPIEVKQFIHRLRRRLEETKILLSSEEKVQFPIEGKYGPITIDRSAFNEQVLEDEQLRLRSRIEHCLNEVSKYKVPINEVLLIGGSSQIPYIKDIILESFRDFGVFEKNIKFCDNMIEAVAKGAAIMSAILAGESVPPFMRNNIQGVVSRDIKIKHANVEETLVSRGVSYPFKTKRVHSFKIGHALSENIEVEIVEMDELGTKETARSICKIDFHLPFFYTGDQIDLALDINNAGLYQLEAKHIPTGEYVEFEPIKPYSLDPLELKKAQENIGLINKK